MLSTHFHTLSCAPDRVGIVCPDCGRSGSYAREKAIAQHGDANLPDFLSAISADCHRRQHTTNGGGCRAQFEPATVDSLRCGK